MEIRNIYKSVFVAALTMLSVSCGNRLNVEPTQSIDETTALSDDQSVKVTLTGAYDGLSGVNVYGGAIQYTGELLGDDREVVFGGTFTTLDELWRKSITTTNGVVTSIWTNSYNTINRANNVLSALEKVNQQDRARVEGEALFIRGSLLFELVRLFGKTWGDGNNATNLGVPIVLTPTRTVTEADFRARNTVEQVYAQVIADLTKAEQQLPLANGIFATKGAAAAMLSRVYLMQGRYAEARDAANRVITSGRYAMARNFADVFTESSGDYAREHIFRIVITDQDGVNAMNTYYASAAFQGRGDIRVQTKHLDLYTPGDVRKDFFYRTGVNTFTSKHRDLYGDVPVVRITEMFLTRAECNFRLGQQVGASPVADINAVRQRAGLPPLTTVTLNDILRERKLELAFEGHQIHDLKRNRLPVNANFNFNSNALVLPIPQREIDTNKNLVQNPGY
ncbi:RagB/SusD family nutrient uptake outer membrane protein [Rhodoflexus caldus]|uniref:RagB/SusD family nutrient uptake outer membrane protein n=1 Tax=Rhodoflexus caldus TaxID=2891236 RepID=UPI00202A2D48|nr:RagB/SusD family nutrient uptake outer membrane protein [Rhodoflexus caldus]